MTRYLFWRRLNVRPEEYDDLPWWVRRLGVEGLNAEGGREQPEAQTLGDLASLGITVRASNGV